MSNLKSIESVDKNWNQLRFDADPRNANDYMYELAEECYKNYVQKIDSFIQNYSSNCENNNNNNNTEKKNFSPIIPDSLNVLLTGASGSLGAQLLYDMLEHNHNFETTKKIKIIKIFCLMRSSTSERNFNNLNENERKIQFQQLILKQFEEKKLNNNYLIEAFSNNMIECFSWDDYQHKLENQKNVEIHLCIHSAWKVNWKLPFEYFEKECIQPSFELALFCIKNKIKLFHNISSAGCIINLNEKPEKEVFEIHYENQRYASPTGYHQSKLCFDKILVELFTKISTLNPSPFSSSSSISLSPPPYLCLTRVGQLSGSSSNGVWNNHSEAWAQLMKLFVETKSFPDNYLPISFFPLNEASKVILNLSLVYFQPENYSTMMNNNKDDKKQREPFLNLVEYYNLVPPNHMWISFKTFKDMVRNSVPHIFELDKNNKNSTENALNSNLSFENWIDKVVIPHITNSSQKSKKEENSPQIIKLISRLKRRMENYESFGCITTVIHCNNIIKKYHEYENFITKMNENYLKLVIEEWINSKFICLN